MLYDLIVGQGQAINGLKQDIDRRFNELDARMSRLEIKVEKNSERIEELFLRGDKIQIGFSRTMLAGNSLLSGIIAFIVAMFTGQYVMKVK